MSPMGTASGSNSPTSDSASVQRADTSLNSCEGAAGSTSEKSRNVPVAALPVTQQMTEMSISREDKITTPKTEVSEPVVTQPSPSVSQPSTSQGEEKAPELPKPKKNRCFMCRKKVGLTGMTEHTRPSIFYRWDLIGSSLRDWVGLNTHRKRLTFRNRKFPEWTRKRAG